MSIGTVAFAPGVYAGIAYGTLTTGWNLYATTVFARIRIPSGTPSKTITDFIGMYGTGGDQFSHQYAIPPNGTQPFTGPAISWQWAGLVNGKPRIWMRDGRPILNAFSQPRNLFPSGLNGAPNFEFQLDAPSALTTGVCHDVCWTWRWTAAALNGQPSDCAIWVDGVQVATYDFPAFLSGQPGWFEAVDTTKKSLTIGGTRDTAGYIPDSGTIHLGELFIVKKESSPTEITLAQALSYYNACPGPGTPAPLIGYDLTSATDLDDSIGSRDLTVFGGAMTTQAGCPCPGDAPPDTGEGGSETIPVCCDDVEPPPGGGGDVGTNPDPVGTLPPWMASCTGGGLVDYVDDLGEGEVW